MPLQSSSIYSKEEQKILFWITKVPALISIICSSIVIYHLLLDRKNRLHKVYGRLWFLISLTNILVAFTSIVAGLANPSDTQVYGAFGNETSCTVMGAVFMFVFVICMGYNASLAVFFFISIHTKWTEREFTTRVEPWLHIVPLLYAIAGVTTGVLTKMFATHDIFLYPWAAPSPFGCRYDGNEGASCQHGNTLRDAFVFLGGLVEMNLLTATKIVATFYLYRTVLVQEKKMQTKYHAKSSGNTIAKETGIQAILFFLSCVVPYGLMILLRIMDLYFWQEDIVKTPGFFWFSAIAQVMFPCQGIMNMICYFRPKVKERQRKVGEGRESILQSSLILMEFKSVRQINKYAAPGGTYGGMTSVSAVTPGSSQTCSDDDNKVDLEKASGSHDDKNESDQVDENMDDIGYLDVKELEKAAGRTFVLGEDMIGDTRQHILKAIEERRQKTSSSMHMMMLSGKSQPRQRESLQHDSPPSLTENMEEARSDDSASSVNSIKRINMIGEVIREKTVEEDGAP